MPPVPRNKRATRRSTLQDAEQGLDQVRYEVARVEYAKQLQQRNPLGSSKRHIDFGLACDELGVKLRQAGERLRMAETTELVRFVSRRNAPLKRR